MAKVNQPMIKGKVLNKSWHSIIATKSFDSTFLGESYVVDPSLMIDRTLTVNLANLSGDIRQQGISLKFRISEVSDGKGIAKVTGYEASPAQLRRLVRRGVDRLDDSIVCETSEGIPVKVKPFAVTRTAASKSKLTLLRKLLREEISKEVKDKTFDDLIKLVISNKLQASLKTSVKKIFPLKALEIRKMQLIESQAAGKKDEKQPAEGAKQEKAEPAPEKEAKKEAKKEKKAEPSEEKKPEKEKDAPEAEQSNEGQKEEQKAQ